MENNLKFNSAICTSKIQSERLLSLGLRKDTADMWYPHFAKTCPLPLVDEVLNSDDIPAWSLHRLLLLIPKEVNSDGYRFPFMSEAVMYLGEVDDMYEYLIGVLERTIKEGYFNKEYLV